MTKYNILSHINILDRRIPPPVTKIWIILNCILAELGRMVSIFDASQLWSKNDVNANCSVFRGLRTNRKKT